MTKRSVDKTGEDHDDFDIVQLEWTDSDERSPEASRKSEDSEKRNHAHNQRKQDKEKLRSNLLAAAMHAVVGSR